MSFDAPRTSASGILADPFAAAAASFRSFFLELRDVFLERDSLFTQLELALLCREHVLVIGPPGTAKSAIAAATLGRIVDANTGQPSLFSRQITESTVQTDLVGPVDFKVLSETGRTEHLTDEGMLGATHAFLDEVFDGRDMLLRSILNVLQERELKHGRFQTRGGCDCAVMTSNRYLSEVLARSPETLQAFADRIAFVCFAPKAFARRESARRMLWRAQLDQQPRLQETLTQQQLATLQSAVQRVEVPALVQEGLHALAAGLEARLLACAVDRPELVPTKYFSQRTLVKALWALKAVVVRQGVHGRRGRRLRAEPADLEQLRAFFLLGGPPAADLEAILEATVDPRERAQLELVRVEQRAFDEVLQDVLLRAGRRRGHEGAGRLSGEDRSSATGLLRSWTPAVGSALAATLLARLRGPVGDELRADAIATAEVVLAAAEQAMVRGLQGGAEARPSIPWLASLVDAVELGLRVPELEGRRSRLGRAALDFGATAVALVQLGVEATEYEESGDLAALTAVSTGAADELARIVDLLRAGATATGDEAAGAAAFRAVDEARLRCGEVLLGRAERLAALGRTLDRRDPEKGPTEKELFERLVDERRRLRELERAVELLSPAARGIARELLAPLGAAWALEAVRAEASGRVSDLCGLVQGVVDRLRREGVSAHKALAALGPLVDERAAAALAALRGLRAPAPPTPRQAVSGEAYAAYVRAAKGEPEGELRAVRRLSVHLRALDEPSPLSPARAQELGALELASLRWRIAYVQAWCDAIQSVEDFDALVRSRLPQLALREGELRRLERLAAGLALEDGAIGVEARELETLVRALAARLLEHARSLSTRRGGVEG